MKKIIAIALIVLPITGFSQGFNLFWGEASAPALNQDGASLVDGSFIQLIVTTAITTNGTPAALNISDSEGLEADYQIAATTASFGGGNIFQSTSSGTSPLTESSVIFARVFSSPGSGGNNIPTPSFDAGEGSNGIWYSDMFVTQIVPNLGSTGLPQYNYQFDVAGGEPAWTFAAIPEPNTIMLLGLGTVAILLRRARRS